MFTLRINSPSMHLSLLFFFFVPRQTHNQSHHLVYLFIYLFFTNTCLSCLFHACGLGLCRPGWAQVRLGWSRLDSDLVWAWLWFRPNSILLDWKRNREGGKNFFLRFKVLISEIRNHRRLVSGIYEPHFEVD